MKQPQRQQLSLIFREILRLISSGRLSFEVVLEALSALAGSALQVSRPTDPLDTNPVPWHAKEWTVQQHVGIGTFLVTVNGLTFWKPPENLTPRTVAEVMQLWERKNFQAVNANVGRHLWEHHLMPEEFRMDTQGRTIRYLFPGTLFLDSEGKQMILVLVWKEGAWQLCFLPTAIAWNPADVLVLRAKSTA